jgi:hypothetical protein
MMPADPTIGSTALLHHLLLSLGPDITSEWKAGAVRYQRAGHLFCIVRPMAKRVDVGFFKFGRARSKRILHAKGKLPFVPYRVEVEAPGDVDTEVRAWLRESYDLAGA